MMNFLKKMAVRKYIYGTMIVLFPLVCFYVPALIPASPLWLALIMAILNLKPDNVASGNLQAGEGE